MNIQEALMNMDALDDDQWTADGMPKLVIVSEVVGKQVSRQDVIDVAPKFTRENMVILENTPEPEKVTEPELDPALPDMELAILAEYLENDPLPEREFMNFLRRVDKTELASLEFILAEQMDEADKAINRAKDLRNRVKLSLAFTKGRIKVEVPDMSNQQAIQAFIASQTTARGERTVKTRELLKGIDLKTLDPRAAIDRAMSRKNKRGAIRPKRALT